MKMCFLLCKLALGTTWDFVSCNRFEIFTYTFNVYQIQRDIELFSFSSTCHGMVLLYGKTKTDFVLPR